MDYIKEFGEKVAIMDQEDGLQVLNYNQCANDSDDALKRVRGIVQEVSSGKVLFETFPYTEEYDISKKDTWVSRVGSLEDWNVYYSLEGTLLRVFWANERWYISTNKKLNAFKSRWSSRKSFGDMFRDGLMAIENDENVLEKFLNQLDKGYVYFFLTRYNQENRVVCQVDKDTSKQVMFIGRTRPEKMELERQWPHPFFMKTPELLELSDVNDFEDLPLDIHNHQGVILFHKTQNTQVKLIHPEYMRLYHIRGNNPNIRFRYLELRQDPILKKDFLKMYPLSQDLFLEYENILYQIAKLVRFYYIQRYIKNKYVTLPKEEYILMKKCHEWYLSNRDENRINVSKVMELLNQEDILSIYKMIRRYQMSQNQGQEEVEYPQAKVWTNVRVRSPTPTQEAMESHIRM